MAMDISIIELRKIEANIIRPIYQEFCAVLGEEETRRVIARAIVHNAIEQGREIADALDGRNDMEALLAVMSRWKQDDALEMDIIKHDEENLHFDVTRCRYAEMYHAMGLAEIGDILSCGRDGAFCTGFNENLKLERSQTIMQGATHCDFRYTLEPGHSRD